MPIIKSKNLLLSVKSEVYDKPIHPPAGGGLTSQMIIESLPERQKKKAGEMIRRIAGREMGSRVWNERGELLDENGLAVVGSSITDLIKTSRSSGKTDKTRTVGGNLLDDCIRLVSNQRRF